MGKSFSFYKELASHSHVQERNREANRIDHDLNMHPTSKSANKIGKSSRGFDHVFWFGDLNYRIDTTFSMIMTLIEKSQFEVLLNNDQLTKEMKKHRCFKGFKEAEISFAPTYKLKSNRQYDAQRIPGYTDRVLFKSQKSIECFFYQSFDLQISDHQAVMWIGAISV